jgi:hypothetical protein
MKINRRILALFCSLFLSSCHTMMESNYKTILSSTTEKNSKGETIYKTKEVQNPFLLLPTTHSISNNDQSFYNPPSPAPETTEPSNAKGFLELANEKNNLHLGLLYGAPFANNFFMGRFGVSLFSSEKEIYAGFDGSVRLQIPQAAYSPFLGAGAYYGDTKKCTSSSNSYVEDCEKKFLFAGYTEIGMTFSNLQLFWRNYNISRAGITIPVDQFWGLGLSFPF